MRPEIITDIPELLVLLKRKNIKLNLKNENIEVVDTDNNLNQELIKLIKSRKSEIIEFLGLYQRKGEYYPIPVAKKKERYALSSMQKRLYFLWEMDKTLTNYNMPNIILLEKFISKDKLTSIIYELFQRHEMFRASFHYHNENHYFKIADYVLPNINYVEAKEGDVSQIIEDFIQPFDLSKAPLLRIQLINIKNSDQLLLIDIHHIISDGISNGILKKEFLSLYNGNTLEPIKIQYKDFTEWQNSEGYKEAIGRQEKYWLDLYSSEINVLQLPTDFLRPKNLSYCGDDVSFIINKNLSDSLRKITKDNGSTLFISLLSIFNILLCKLSNQEEIVIGVPVAGRNQPHLEKLIGFFINTLALRNKPKAEITFNEFIEQVKANTLIAFDNQDYGFGELVERINVNRDTSRNPLFDVMFNLLNHRENKNTQQSTVKYIGIKKIAKFDLTLTSIEREDEILCSFNYSINLFERHTIQRFAKYFLSIISKVSNNGNIRLSDIEILSKNEKNKILYEFNNTKVDYAEDKTIIDLFDEQVRSTPYAIAVKKANNQISYVELNNRVNQLGKLLRDKGVGRNHIVGIMTKRSIDLIIGIYGILKAGGAYLPIDPNYPDDRKTFMINKSKCKILLTEEQYLGIVTGEFSTINIEDKIVYKNSPLELKNITIPMDLVYVIYTSGSTGIPKGAGVRNNSFVNLVSWYTKELAITREDNILLIAPISFDLAQKNLFASLLNGTCLHLAEENNLNYCEIADIIQKDNISIVNSAPVAFYQLLPNDINDNFRKLARLRKVVLGGEPINKKVFTEWQDTKYFNADIINSYGPTECTDVVTCHQVEKEEWITDNSISIGKPIDNVDIYILNKNKGINPVGVVGEICIGGLSVSNGYIDDSLLTKEKFVLNHFGKGSMYKTGDLARWLPDGKIEYIGRIDHQVKIRGIRIEIGEIETVLAKHDNIKDAIAIVKGEESEKFICAYIVSDIELEISELRGFLLKSLPEYMIPSYFVRIEKIPLTPSGKIDKKALPEPEFIVGDCYVAPSNEMEKKLVTIWSEVLIINEDQISVNRSFFELGGHSLKAVILRYKINREIGVNINLSDLFEWPTIKDLASILANSELQDQKELPKAKYTEYFSMTQTQQRLLFLQNFDPNSTAYNVNLIVELNEFISEDKVRQALQEIVNRHESLRTYFEFKDNEMMQRVVPVINVEIYNKHVTKEKINEEINEFVKSFDLSTPPLFKTGCFTSPQKRILVFNTHHIILDGHSLQILKREFNDIIEGKELPKVKYQFRDYVTWIEGKEQQERIEKAEQFWKKELEGGIPEIDLPYDKSESKGNIGQKIGFTLNDEISNKFFELAKENNVTIFSLIASVYSICLANITMMKDVVFGLPVYGRNHNDLENIVGMFVNNVAVRSKVDEKISFKEFLLDLHKRGIGILEHQDYPFSSVISKICKQKSNPIKTDLIFNQLNSENIYIEPIEEQQKDLNFEIKTDIALFVYRSNNNLQFIFSYNGERFLESTIVSFKNIFITIIKSITGDPNVLIESLLHSPGFESVSSELEDDFFTNIENAEFNE